MKRSSRRSLGQIRADLRVVTMSRQCSRKNASLIVGFGAVSDIFSPPPLMLVVVADVGRSYKAFPNHVHSNLTQLHEPAASKNHSGNE